MFPVLMVCNTDMLVGGSAQSPLPWAYCLLLRGTRSIDGIGLLADLLVMQ